METLSFPTIGRSAPNLFPFAPIEPAGQGIPVRLVYFAIVTIYELAICADQRSSRRETGAAAGSVRGSDAAAVRSPLLTGMLLK